MLFDILVSMITGLYSGLIASKYIRYVHIRAQALQLVKQIEHLHGHDEHKVATLRHRDYLHLKHLAGELEALGYKAAAGMVKRAKRLLREADAQGHTEAQVQGLVDAWLQEMRHHRPAIMPTLMAWKI